jgi:hypothetical protein
LVVRITGLHLYPCSYIMSLIDRFVIIHLTILATVGSWVQDFIFQISQSPFCTQTPVIYIMTIKLVTGTEILSISFLLYPSPTDRCVTLSLFSIVHNHGFGVPRLASSQKAPNSNCSCPSPPSSCFSQCAFSMV